MMALTNFPGGASPIQESTWTHDLERVGAFVREIDKAGLTIHSVDSSGKITRRVTLSFCLAGTQITKTGKTDDKFLLILARDPIMLNEFCSALRNLRPTHPVRMEARKLDGIVVKKDLVGARTAEGLPVKSPIMDLFLN
jgi:hypothetical protein